jgi:hypothetical protein
MRLPLPALLLLLASCGGASEAPKNDDDVDVPVPSGPPVAQQADAVPSSAPGESGPTWESAASGEGTALRLTAPDGRLLLSIACLRTPRRLIASAPGFKAIGSEDRFSLGLGEEPVTLVADPTRQEKSGVTAEGAVPASFGKLLDEAKQVSALYGSQQIGPHPAPGEALKEALARDCASSK